MTNYVVKYLEIIYETLNKNYYYILTKILWLGERHKIFYCFVRLFTKNSFNSFMNYKTALSQQLHWDNNLECRTNTARGFVNSVSIHDRLLHEAASL